jgi:hypothetical protein
MAVVNIYGAKGRALREAFPPVPAVPRFYGGGLNHIVDSAAFANTDSIASKCFLGEVPSHAVINPASTLYFGAFGTSCTLNIGDANDEDGLATVIAVASAGNSPILEAMSAQNFVKQLWEHLGYAKDPGRMIDLYASVAGAAVSTSTAWLTWNLMFSVR